MQRIGLNRMNTIVKYLRDNQGYARMKAMKASGFQTRDIQILVQQGDIVKVKPGLYRIADLQSDEMSGIVEVCRAIPKAVVCLSSALAFHDLTTFVPTSVSVAIPRSDKPAKLDYPPFQTYYFAHAQYKAGIEHHESKTGVARIYSPEKTVCDCFRFRNKLGEDLALEGLKEYLRLRKRNLSTLMKFAEICRVRAMVAQYVKAIVG